MLYIGCLWSACIFVHSMSVETSRLICDSTIQTYSIPLSIYKFPFLVGIKHPVIRRISFVAVSTFLVCTEFFYTGQAYSAVEKHNAMVGMRSVTLSASH